MCVGGWVGGSLLNKFPKGATNLVCNTVKSSSNKIQSLFQTTYCEHTRSDIQETIRNEQDECRQKECYKWNFKEIY